MKPLSELVQEIQGKGAHVYSLALAEKTVSLTADNTEVCKAFNDGMNRAAELLQAWLREADEYLRVEVKLCEGMQLCGRGEDVNQHYGGRVFSSNRFREVLLGTTRTEGKK